MRTSVALTVVALSGLLVLTGCTSEEPKLPSQVTATSDPGISELPSEVPTNIPVAPGTPESPELSSSELTAEELAVLNSEVLGDPVTEATAIPIESSLGVKLVEVPVGDENSGFTAYLVLKADGTFLNVGEDTSTVFGWPNVTPEEAEELLKVYSNSF